MTWMTENLHRHMSSENDSQYMNEAITQLSQYIGLRLRLNIIVHTDHNLVVFSRERMVFRKKKWQSIVKKTPAIAQSPAYYVMYMRIHTRDKLILSPYENLLAASSMASFSCLVKIMFLIVFQLCGLMFRVMKGQVQLRHTTWRTTPCTNTQSQQH